MIEIKNVTKRFNNELALNNVSISFQRAGLVIIKGPSGCGKTTLLNVISSLLPFDGEILLDGKRYSKMSNKEKDMIRNQKIGFIFQDFKLFEFESVRKNILLAMDISSIDLNSRKERRVDDLLKLVGLSEYRNQLVQNLSGGEKQRVAIARALANSPKIILADEPTGNLDEANSKIVMETLNKISKKSLVIMVTHEPSIAKEYGTQIVEMKDGEIISNKLIEKEKKETVLPLIRLSYRNDKQKLPFGFLLSHTFNSIKQRKWRNLFSIMATSLGLVGIGLAGLLSEVVSSNLYRSYSSILDDDKIIVSNENPNIKKDIVTSINYLDAIDYKNRYENISDIGVFYFNNLDNFFPTYNSIYLKRTGYKKSFCNLSASSINEFEMLDEYRGDIYPSRPIELYPNEVVISLSMLQISELCYQLHIPRTIDSLSKYIEENNYVTTIFEFANDRWSYAVEFEINIVGFILSNTNLIYQTDRLWNEFIFEDVMSLPTTNIINQNTANPWDLKKCYYLEFSENRDEFLIENKFSSIEIDYEILDKKYYPTRCEHKDTFECNRVIPINRENKDITPSFIGKNAPKVSKNVKSAIYGSSNGYAIYDQSLMSGFARHTFLSKSLNDIDDIVDLMSYIKYEDSNNITLPKNMVEGHFTKTKTEGLTFEPNYKLVAGRKPINYQEIVVSNSLLKKLGIENPINQTIYFSFPVREDLNPKGYLSRDFVNVPLKIVGVSNSGRYSLSHNEEWSILFFQCSLGISTFDLSVENIALQIDKDREVAVIKLLEKAFPDYKFSSPLNDVKSSVLKICGYIETIMLICSIASVVIASLILFICNYLHFIETKKDIGLIRCLGVSKSESYKFIFSHSIVMTLIAFILSSIELLLVAFILSKALAKALYIESMFVFNPISLFLMLGLSLLISVISSLFLVKKVSFLDPLSCLS